VRKTHAHGSRSPAALECNKGLRSGRAAGKLYTRSRELGVTHGAVSRQIRLLEEWLGAALFLRTSRNAVPTPAAMDLLAEAGPALDRLATASLRVQSGKALGVLRISALPTFAMRWLIPRLPQLQREHPALETRIVISQAATGEVAGILRQSFFCSLFSCCK
jgi:LysR family glycine cleavage system transcriptional activator